MIAKASWAVFRKDVRAELRTRYALNALALFAVSTVVAISLGVGPLTRSADLPLIHAALLLEYIEPSAVLQRVAGWLAPGGVFSVVLQLPGGDARISATGFASLRTLSDLMRLVDPDELRGLATGLGLVELSSREVPLTRGKSFWVATFGRAGG